MTVKNTFSSKSVVQFCVCGAGRLQDQSNKESEKAELKLALWVPASVAVAGGFQAFFGGGTRLTILGEK